MSRTREPASRPTGPPGRTSGVDGRTSVTATSTPTPRAPAGTRKPEQILVAPVKVPNPRNHVAPREPGFPAPKGDGSVVPTDGTLGLPRAARRQEPREAR
ncbi:hypothetical protein GCM10027605_35720 [Micromonospora zhanjiangensis]